MDFYWNSRQKENQLVILRWVYALSDNSFYITRFVRTRIFSAFRNEAYNLLSHLATRLLLLTTWEIVQPARLLLSLWHLIYQETFENH